jgi:alkylation response protein AidB-like acyl-CoA dehydrogenase
MDFDFSFEQQLLAESVRRTLEELPPVTEPAARPYAAAAVMAKLVGLGIFAEDEAGAPALSFSDATAVAIEVGRQLPCAPISESIAAWLCADGMRPQLRAAFASGRHVTMAVSGALGQDGGRALVPFAEGAEAMLLPFAGSASRQWGILNADVVTLDAAATSDITIDAQWVTTKAPPAATLANQPIAPDDALTLLAMAEMVGAAEICLERTVDYIRERQQFGKPIGSNQAIKHMAADAALAVQTMRAAVEYAGWSLDQAGRDGSEEREVALLTARCFIGDGAREVIERCIQMHGAIAFTWDYGMHRYLRRVLYRANTVVRPLQSREQIAALISGGCDALTGLVIRTDVIFG